MFYFEITTLHSIAATGQFDSAVELVASIGIVTFTWSSLAVAVRVWMIFTAKLGKLQVVVVVSSQGRQMGCELAARGESGGW